MAVHRFICDDCGITIEDSNTKFAHSCPKCHSEMRWDLSIGIHGNYQNPIHSDALAIHPDQRAEHEREFPNVRLDGECRPVFDNYVDHEAYLKKTGFIKTRQKTNNLKATV